MGIGDGGLGLGGDGVVVEIDDGLCCLWETHRWRRERVIAGQVNVSVLVDHGTIDGTRGLAVGGVKTLMVVDIGMVNNTRGVIGGGDGRDVSSNVNDAIDDMVVVGIDLHVEGGVISKMGQVHLVGGAGAIINNNRVAIGRIHVVVKDDAVVIVIAEEEGKSRLVDAIVHVGQGLINVEVEDGVVDIHTHIHGHGHGVGGVLDLGGSGCGGHEDVGVVVIVIVGARRSCPRR